MQTKPLRLALATNALFSFSSGLLLLMAPDLAGDWLGLHAPAVFQLTGGGLLLFAADLIHQASRPRLATWRALLASAADFFWVIGTVLLLGFLPGLLSPSGTWLALGVAAAVGIFGILQIHGAGRVHAIRRTGVYRHCLAVRSDVPPEDMWRVVGNLGEIRKYMPALKSSRIDGGEPGIGVVRTCEDHKGKRWSEECISFEAGRSFSVRFVTEDPGFPFPASSMLGGWEVRPDPDGSIVTVWWELTPKPEFLAPLLLPLLAFQADRDFPKIIHRMAVDALGHSPGNHQERRSTVLSGLLPNPC